MADAPVTPAPIVAAPAPADAPGTAPEETLEEILATLDYSTQDAKAIRLLAAKLAK
jgi:hypothetical protein